MTDAERARALSGATRECRTLYNALTGPDCPDCHGTGRVFILGERARKVCPGLHQHKPGILVSCDLAGCSGSLSTLLLPDGRWDIGLVIELLEAARIDVSYGRCLEGVHEGKCWYVSSSHSAHDKVLAVAACEALGVGTEVRG